MVAAINDYELKLAVALRDPDLEALRERREWTEALNQVKGALRRGRVASQQHFCVPQKCV